jgi:hypothetical protein
LATGAGASSSLLLSLLLDEDSSFLAGVAAFLLAFAGVALAAFLATTTGASASLSLLESELDESSFTGAFLAFAMVLAVVYCCLGCFVFTHPKKIDGHHNHLKFMMDGVTSSVEAGATVECARMCELHWKQVKVALCGIDIHCYR